MTPETAQDNVKKSLAEAWARFINEISRVRNSTFSLRRQMEDRRRRKILAEAWARFTARMARIRGAALALMHQMEDRRRDQELEEARRRLQKL